MLNARINKILLAENDPVFCHHLKNHLQAAAPSASIRCAHSITETYKIMESWKPVLAVIDFTLQDGSFIAKVPLNTLSFCVPFVIGITEVSTCEEIAYAMSHGFHHVLSKPFSQEKFTRVLLQTVSEPEPLQFSINKLINPLLYDTNQQLNLKKLNEEIEHHIFMAASNVVQSKNGLARLLGISRQLVQYHLKKMATHP